MQAVRRGHSFLLNSLSQVARGMLETTCFTLEVIVIVKYLSIIFSFMRMWVQLTGKSDEVKFQRYKEEGTEIKESGQLGRAMKFYKKALDIAQTNDQHAEIWALTVYVYIDRAIGAGKQYSGKSGHILSKRNAEGNIVPGILDHIIYQETTSVRVERNF